MPWTFYITINNTFKLTIIIMYCECCSLSPLSRLKFCFIQLPQSVYSVGGFATEAIIQRSATPASVLCPWVRNGHYAARSGAANPLTLDLGFVPRGWTCRGYTVDGPGNRTSSVCSCGRRENLSQIRGRGRAAPLPDMR